MIKIEAHSMSIQSLKKWGNSPAVRIPAAVMEAARLSLNQPVEVRAENGRVIIEPATQSYALADLLAGITPDNHHVEADFGVPQGRELL
jgi:antitoxin MazE